MNEDTGRGRGALRRWARRAARALLLFSSGLALYVALLLNPDRLFAHEARFANVVQQEGYADYVGKGGAFDFDAAPAALRAGERELDPERSGLYLRYHLLIAYMLERQGLTPEELLARPRSSVPLEAALLEGALLERQP